MVKNHVRKFSESEVIFGPEIGRGSFGIVYKGTLKVEKCKDQIIAIKAPKKELMDDIMNELEFLAIMKHTNIVYFYGVLVVDSGLGINLIFEFLDGNARTFVMSQDWSKETLLGISHDIACGMNYIHEMNILHRDLAARNVLVNSINMAKIADFGLSRLIDTNHDHCSISEKTIIPTRWVPRECLQTGGKFSKSSDIWSFGVTLWEIWNKAKIPYGVPNKAETTYRIMNDEEVRLAISEGKNPMSFEIPEGMPEEIVELLEDIFVEKDLRPSFANIKISIEEISKGNLKKSHKGQIRQFGGQCSKSEAFFTAKSLFSKPPEQNLAEFEIHDVKYNLLPANVEILSSLKENYTVKTLICTNISAQNLKKIGEKFKAIKQMTQFHTGRQAYGKCEYFSTRSVNCNEDCMFKLININEYEKLMELNLVNLEINASDVNIGHLNLPALKILEISSCKIRGNLINAITGLLSLERILFWGNTPSLEKSDVNTLLRIKSLRYIELTKCWGLPVISGSFAPIGPNGHLMEMISPDAGVQFERESECGTWKLTLNSKIQRVIIDNWQSLFPKLLKIAEKFEGIRRYDVTVLDHLRKYFEYWGISIILIISILIFKIPNLKRI